MIGLDDNDKPGCRKKHVSGTSCNREYIQKTAITASIDDRNDCGDLRSPNSRRDRPVERGLREPIDGDEPVIPNYEVEVCGIGAMRSQYACARIEFERRAAMVEDPSHARCFGIQHTLKEADIADPSFIDELEESGFIDQLYAAYRPLPALSGSPSSKSEASGFAPFSDVVLRISRDVVASTNATVARPEWRPCSWRYSRQSKRDVQDLGLPFRTHPQSAVLE